MKAEKVSNMSDPIRIMIVEDHAVVRQGLVALLRTVPEFAIVAEAADGHEAIELFRRHQPDVTLMDLRLPRMNGVEAIAAIRVDFPQARIIVLTTFDGDEDIYRALQAGARGYLLKGMTGDELMEAIRSVYGGKSRIPSPVAERLAERMSAPVLTARETEVLQLIVGGNSNKEIAAALFISEATVKTHINSLLNKLGVTDRTQAATTALQRGIVHLDWNRVPVSPSHAPQCCSYWRTLGPAAFAIRAEVSAAIHDRGAHYRQQTGQETRVWRTASEAELKALIPARAPVISERIETEFRTASGISDDQGHGIAGVVLITAGYSADGKYSHYFVSQVPLKVGDFLLPPGQYLIGWVRGQDTLKVTFYLSQSGQPVGQVVATRNLGNHPGGILSHLATCGQVADPAGTLHLRLRADWALTDAGFLG